MIFRQLFDSTSGTYSYLIASRHGAEALVIDPVLEKVDRYIQLLNELDLKLVKAIQVDGGSEFMAEFEAACENKAITLFVLPPKSPKLNGAVERCNGAWRYEFYETYDLPNTVEALNPILDSFQHLYNHHRPHGALSEFKQI